MQDWDRLAMIMVGAGVALYTAYDGWRFWRRRQRGAAAGLILLALATVVTPVVLALVGGK